MIASRLVRVTCNIKSQIFSLRIGSRPTVGSEEEENRSVAHYLARVNKLRIAHHQESAGPARESLPQRTKLAAVDRLNSLRLCAHRAAARGDSATFCSVREAFHRWFGIFCRNSRLSLSPKVRLSRLSLVACSRCVVQLFESYSLQSSRRERESRLRRAESCRLCMRAVWSASKKKIRKWSGIHRIICVCFSHLSASRSSHETVSLANKKRHWK